MSSATPTIKITFGAGSDASLLATAFLDEVLNAAANGEPKSSFSPGDPAYFLVHLDPKLRISRIDTSSGEVFAHGQVSRQETSRLEFAEITDTMELSKIPASPPSAIWYGREPSLIRAGRTLSVSAAPAIGDITNTYQASSWMLVPPTMTIADDADYPILIVVSVEEAT